MTQERFTIDRKLGPVRTTVAEGGVHACAESAQPFDGRRADGRSPNNAAHLHALPYAAGRASDHFDRDD